MTIISDPSTEDKGYDRSHRQTQGGYEAYERGEAPMSRWNKKMLLEQLFEALNKIREVDEYHLKYLDMIRRTGWHTPEIREALINAPFEKLKKHFLEFKGVHYCGNYYRRTRFYGIINSQFLFRVIEINFITPKQPKQLKLEGIL